MSNVTMSTDTSRTDAQKRECTQQEVLWSQDSLPRSMPECSYSRWVWRRGMLTHAEPPLPPPTSHQGLQEDTHHRYRYVRVIVGKLQGQLFAHAYFSMNLDLDILVSHLTGPQSCAYWLVSLLGLTPINYTPNYIVNNIRNIAEERLLRRLRAVINMGDTQERAVIVFSLFHTSVSKLFKKT